ncbi:MAG TPA: PLDc N-terminal domain-containing protein [Amnibacterium sp.]
MARIELVVALIVLVLELYSIVNCILTPDAQVKGIPKALWLVLIVLLPLLGSVLWLGVGRDRGVPAPRRGPMVAPPAVPPSGYAAMTAEERIRRMEEDLARLERESGEDGAAPRG